MGFCCVMSCLSVASEVTMCPVPADPKRLAEWEEILGQKLYSKNEVCIKHFAYRNHGSSGRVYNLSEPIGAGYVIASKTKVKKLSRPRTKSVGKLSDPRTVTAAKEPEHVLSDPRTVTAAKEPEHELSDARTVSPQPEPEPPTSPKPAEVDSRDTVNRSKNMKMPIKNDTSCHKERGNPKRTRLVFTDPCSFYVDTFVKIKDDLPNRLHAYASCSVVHCPSTTEDAKDMALAPRNQSERIIWERLLGQKLNSSSYVCCKHFPPGSISNGTTPNIRPYKVGLEWKTDFQPWWRTNNENIKTLARVRRNRLLSGTYTSVQASPEQSNTSPSEPCRPIPTEQPNKLSEEHADTAPVLQWLAIDSTVHAVLKDQTLITVEKSTIPIIRERVKQQLKLDDLRETGDDVPIPIDFPFRHKQTTRRMIGPKSVMLRRRLEAEKNKIAGTLTDQSERRKQLIGPKSVKLWRQLKEDQEKNKTAGSLTDGSLHRKRIIGPKSILVPKVFVAGQQGSVQRKRIINVNKMPIPKQLTELYRNNMISHRARQSQQMNRPKLIMLPKLYVKQQENKESSALEDRLAQSVIPQRGEPFQGGERQSVLQENIKKSGLSSDRPIPEQSLVPKSLLLPYQLDKNTNKKSSLITEPPPLVLFLGAKSGEPQSNVQGNIKKSGLSSDRPIPEQASVPKSLLLPYRLEKDTNKKSSSITEPPGLVWFSDAKSGDPQSNQQDNSKKSGLACDRSIPEKSSAPDQLEKDSIATNKESALLVEPQP